MNPNSYYSNTFGQAPMPAYVDDGSSNPTAQHRPDGYPEIEFRFDHRSHGASHTNNKSHSPRHRHREAPSYPAAHDNAYIRLSPSVGHSNQAGPGALPARSPQKLRIPSNNVHRGSHSRHDNQYKGGRSSLPYSPEPEDFAPLPEELCIRTIYRDERGGPTGPKNRILVPLQTTSDRVNYSTVTFQEEGSFDYGVHLSDVLRNRSILVRGNEVVPKDIYYREITLKMPWPGYDFRKAKKIKPCTRTELLEQVVAFVKKFYAENKGISVPPGFENWKIGERPSISIDDLIITGLIHDGGASWHPEIWY